MGLPPYSSASHRHVTALAPYCLATHLPPPLLPVQLCALKTPVVTCEAVLHIKRSEMISSNKFLLAMKHLEAITTTRSCKTLTLSFDLRSSAINRCALVDTRIRSNLTSRLPWLLQQQQQHEATVKTATNTWRSLYQGIRKGRSACVYVRIYMLDNCEYYMSL